MASPCCAPWWWPWWCCSLVTATGKRARSTPTWQWPTAADTWMAPSMSCQMSLPATATTTPIPATTPCHSAPLGPHPRTRFLGVNSSPACRALNGQGEPRDLTAMPLCQPTGSTDETLCLGLQIGEVATWTEVTPTAMAVAQAPSSVKGPSLRKG